MQIDVILKRFEQPEPPEPPRPADLLTVGNPARLSCTTERGANNHA
jgi:hypothetical protein